MNIQMMLRWGLKTVWQQKRQGSMLHATLTGITQIPMLYPVPPDLLEVAGDSSLIFHNFHLQEFPRQFVLSFINPVGKG